MRGACYVSLIGVLAVAAFWAGTCADRVLGVSPSVAHADAHTTPVIADRTNVLHGQTVGEVTVNDDVVIRMRTSAGGLTAAERATIIANRLRQWVSATHSPWDLAVRRGAFGGAELRAAGNLIVDVNVSEANAIGSTPAGLATAWRNNIMTAMGVTPPPTLAGVPVAPVTDGEVDPEQIQDVSPTPPQPVGYSDRIVPIFSLGRGTRIGAARVNGPSDAIGRVQGVTQLETRFQNFLVIDIYVPVTTEGGLDRVQRVGVTAIGDLGI